jgi:hypothetical protein
VAHFSKYEIAATAFEKLFAERVFQKSELSADRRLRHVKFVGRFSDPSFSGDRPEVAQVMKIQPFHSNEAT